MPAQAIPARTAHTTPRQISRQQTTAKSAVRHRNAQHLMPGCAHRRFHVGDCTTTQRDICDNSDETRRTNASDRMRRIS